MRGARFARDDTLAANSTAWLAQPVVDLVQDEWPTLKRRTRSLSVWTAARAPARRTRDSGGAANDQTRLQEDALRWCTILPLDQVEYEIRDGIGQLRDILVDRRQADW